MATSRRAVHPGGSRWRLGAPRSRGDCRRSTGRTGRAALAVDTARRVSHTQPPDAATLLPGVSVAASERLWGEQQADLTTLLPNSQQILAEESGHYIQRDQPDLVIDAIGDVIQAVRDSSS